MALTAQSFAGFNAVIKVCDTENGTFVTVDNVQDPKLNSNLATDDTTNNSGSGKATHLATISSYTFDFTIVQFNMFIASTGQKMLYDLSPLGTPADIWVEFYAFGTQVDKPKQKFKATITAFPYDSKTSAAQRVAVSMQVNGVPVTSFVSA